MKPQQIFLLCAAALLIALSAAVAQTRLNSSEITRSLQGVSGGKVALTAAAMRQAALDNIRNYPGQAAAAAAHPLSFPELEKLAPVSYTHLTLPTIYSV